MAFFGLHLLLTICLLSISRLSEGDEAACSHPGSAGNTLAAIFRPEDHRYVHDFRNGSTLEVVKATARFPVVVVLLYAAWSAESIAAAEPFAKVAKTMGENPEYSGVVHFAAIDCWCVVGLCRKIPLTHSYPKVVAYRMQDLQRPAQYSGVISAWRLEHHIRRIVQPLIHIKDTFSLKHYLALHENVVLGYAAGDAMASEEQHVVHLRNLAWNGLVQGTAFLDGVRYAVTSSSAVAQHLNVTAQSSVTMVTALGRTETHDGKASFPALRQLTGALPPECVSEYSPREQHHDVFAKGAVVLLFLPLGDADKRHTYLKLLHRVAMPHCQCQYACSTLHGRHEQCCQYLPTALSRYLPDPRDPRPAHSNAGECGRSRGDAGDDEDDGDDEQDATGVDNQQQQHQHQQHSANGDVSEAEECPPLPHSKFLSSSAIFMHLVLKRCAHLPRDTRAFLLWGSHAWRCAGATFQQCQRFHHCRCDALQQPAAAEDSPRSAAAASADAARLRLAFRYADIAEYGALARRLGVRDTSATAGVAMVIVDGKAGNAYLFDETLHGRLSGSRMNAFIHNFAHGTLDASQFSERPAKTGETEREPNTAHATERAPLPGARRSGTGDADGCAGSPLCANIQSVSADSFGQEVLNSSKNVFLMYHLPSLGLSMASLVAFAETAKLLSADDTVQFARIRMDRNSLPRRHTPPRLPAFVLFPLATAALGTAPSGPYRFPPTAPLDADHLRRFLAHYLPHDGDGSGGSGSSAARNDSSGNDASNPRCTDGPCAAHTAPSLTPSQHDQPHHEHHQQQQQQQQQQQAQRQKSKQLLHDHARKLSAELKALYVPSQWKEDTENSHSHKAIQLQSACKHARRLLSDVGDITRRLDEQRREQRVLATLATTLARRTALVRRTLATAGLRTALRRDTHDLRALRRLALATRRQWRSESAAAESAAESCLRTPVECSLRTLYVVLSSCWRTHGGRRCAKTAAAAVQVAGRREDSDGGDVPAQVDDANDADVMGDANSRVDDVMGDANSRGDDVMGDANSRVDDVMGDANSRGDDVMGDANSRVDDVMDDAVNRVEDVLVDSSNSIDDGNNADVVGDANSRVDDVMVDSSSAVDDVMGDAVNRVEDVMVDPSTPVDDVTGDASSSVDDVIYADAGDYRHLAEDPECDDDAGDDRRPLPASSNAVTELLTAAVGVDARQPFATAALRTLLRLCDEQELRAAAAAMADRTGGGHDGSRDDGGHGRSIPLLLDSVTQHILLWHGSQREHRAGPVANRELAAQLRLLRELAVTSGDALQSATERAEELVVLLNESKLTLAYVMHYMRSATSEMASAGS